ncbi:MvdC/MvdD family ATP grasp protein [Streptomyces sp. NRRL S-920]|uniref:MvdC/MvdD family ATP grasp protein n=1 Tax=Streptomyces sp. NRRL S-920 TaxID=1463921 RepID=UPI002D21C7E9|nr:hypothetical protein [Streptomyces sp. NRRL S-920]
MAVGGPPVLVVTRLDDATADEVITELDQRRVPVVRLDPGDFPREVTLSGTFAAIGTGGTIATASRSVDLGNVRSVYWRRPTPYAADLAMDEQTGRWAVEEARYGLGGILAALPGAHYLNHPWRNRDAEYKPVQLATAATCGFTVPPTLITTTPSAPAPLPPNTGRSSTSRSGKPSTPMTPAARSPCGSRTSSQIRSTTVYVTPRTSSSSASASPPTSASLPSATTSPPSVSTVHLAWLAPPLRPALLRPRARPPGHRQRSARLPRSFRTQLRRLRLRSGP